MAQPIGADPLAVANWQACTFKDHSQDGIDEPRWNQHAAAYQKPLPSGYWQWHCVACNAPEKGPPA